MTDLIPYFVSGGGFAGLVALAFIFGFIFPKSVIEEKNTQIDYLEDQIDKLERTLELERARSDTAVTAASVTRDVLQAFRKEITP